MFTGIWYTNIPNFLSLSWFWRCKEHPCPFSPGLGLRWGLEVPDWGSASWPLFGYGHWFLIDIYCKFGLSILILKVVQRTSMSFKPWLGALDNSGGSSLRFGSWSWFRHENWSFIHPWPKFWLPILMWKVQRSFVSFKFWFLALEDTVEVPDTPIFQILALFFYFEGI